MTAPQRKPRMEPITIRVKGKQPQHLTTKAACQKFLRELPPAERRVWEAFIFEHTKGGNDAA